MHELLSHKDIQKLFKPIYYTYIPIEYIYNVELTYRSGEVKLYTRQQIENKIRSGNSKGDGYAKIIDLYDDEKIQTTEINLDFKKITNHINNTLVQTLHQHSKDKKKDA